MAIAIGLRHHFLVAGLLGAVALADEAQSGPRLGVGTDAAVLQVHRQGLPGQRTQHLVTEQACITTAAHL